MKGIDRKRSQLTSSKINNETEDLMQQPVEVSRHEQAEAVVTYGIPWVIPDTL